MKKFSQKCQGRPRLEEKCQGSAAGKIILACLKSETSIITGSKYQENSKKKCHGNQKNISQIENRFFFFGIPERQTLSNFDKS